MEESMPPERATTMVRSDRGTESLAETNRCGSSRSARWRAEKVAGELTKVSKWNDASESLVVAASEVAAELLTVATLC
jgi:hypothetical protein